MTNEEYDNWWARSMGYKDAKHMDKHNTKKDKKRVLKYGQRLIYGK